MKQRLIQAMAVALLCASAQAQVNSGSDGSDGAFNPTTNIVINMADHPNGIYQYTSVNISNGIMVTFIPNANNTPVVWLLQNDCVIAGTVDVSGQTPLSAMGGLGGPGGFRGGSGGDSGGAGQGLGGGSADLENGNSASYGTLGTRCRGVTNGLGSVYGGSFLVPLLGGSGGGGATRYPVSGGGGGGAILVAAHGYIELTGTILTAGGAGFSLLNNNYPYHFQGGGGSGGAVRFVASKLLGTGLIDASGGIGTFFYESGYSCSNGRGGFGRVRLDVLESNFGGTINGAFTQGFQPIIIPKPGQGAQLTITTVGALPVSASPTGTLSTPDAVLSAQQNNPIPIVVHCSNIPLNTQITVSVRPATGPVVSATGLNNTGTQASSTATVLLNLPRGGGLVYATAATGN